MPKTAEQRKRDFLGASIMFGMSSGALAKRLREAISIDFEKDDQGQVTMIVKWGSHEIIRKVIPEGVFG